MFAVTRRFAHFPSIVWWIFGVLAAVALGSIFSTDSAHASERWVSSSGLLSEPLPDAVAEVTDAVTDAGALAPAISSHSVPTAEAVSLVGTVTAPPVVPAPLAPVVQPVAPVVQAIAPVVATVTDAVRPVSAPVAPVVTKVADVLAPATTVVTPVTKVLEPVTDVVAPVTDVLAPVTDLVLPVPDAPSTVITVITDAVTDLPLPVVGADPLAPLPVPPVTLPSPLDGILPLPAVVFPVVTLDEIPASSAPGAPHAVTGTNDSPDRAMDARRTLSLPPAAQGSEPPAAPAVFTSTPVAPALPAAPVGNVPSVALASESARGGASTHAALPHVPALRHVTGITLTSPSDDALPTSPVSGVDTSPD